MYWKGTSTLHYALLTDNSTSSDCCRRWLDQTRANDYSHPTATEDDSTRLIPAITLSDCRRRLFDPTRSDRLPMSHFQHGSNFHKGTTTRTSTRGIQLDCNRTNQCQGIAIPTIKLLSTNYKRTITLTWTLLRVLRILHTAWWLPMTFLLESWITNKPKDEIWCTGKLAQISENHETVWNTFLRSPGALVFLRPKTPLQYNGRYCKQLQSTALDSSGTVVLQKKILFCKISKI